MRVSSRTGRFPSSRSRGSRRPPRPAGSGLSDDAYSKALEICRRSIETGSKTNVYWLSACSGCLERGDGLDKVVKLGAFFETVKKSDVDALAAHALDPSKAWIAILEPEEKD